MALKAYLMAMRLQISTKVTSNVLNVVYKGGYQMNKYSVYETNSFYWDTKGNDFLSAIVLPHYGAFITEEKHQLFGDVSGLKMLEVGCGNGQSLQYHGDRKAGELWGMDISQKQIEKTQQHLRTYGIPATLICSLHGRGMWDSY